MAQPGSFNGSKILIMIGDGGDPETFAHPCLINSTRSVEGTATTVDSVIPDCADQDAPAWTSREKDALSYSISGEGICDDDSVAEYRAWLISPAAKNVKQVISSENGRTLTGKFHLTTFSVTGERKGKATASIALISDGPVVDSANS